MTSRVALLALLVVSGIALAGCSGGGGASSSSTQGTGVTTPTTSGPDIVTYTQTTTISGQITTITSTVTQTPTTSGEVPPTNLPVVSNVTAVPGGNSAVVAWEIDGGVGTLQSHVEYGFSSLTNFTSQTATIAGPGAQTQTITGLSSCNEYKYRVAATDGGGTTVRTTPATFLTTAGSVALDAGTITVPTSTVIDTSFIVKWTVAGPVDSKSHVEYGLTAALGSTTTDVSGTGAQSAVLTGLTAGQAYNYHVVVTSPCGSKTFPAGAPLLQKTAVVVHVDINQGAQASANVNAFTPGSTVGKAVAAKQNEPIVFDITNKDSSPTPVIHTFLITDSTGAPVGYSSPDITAGNTYHFPTSYNFPTVGTYHMKCAHHSTMSGDITVTA